MYLFGHPCEIETGNVTVTLTMSDGGHLVVVTPLRRTIASATPAYEPDWSVVVAAISDYEVKHAR